MPGSDVRAEELAARLWALGLAPRVERHVRHISIEVEVPEAVAAETWRAVLAVAAEADRFGLIANEAAGRILWAAVDRTAPATGDVRGPGHQR
ncbi:hypothetical protein [Streptomyces sp. NPDC089919]|uniref:hypothetical protein n=1 Tax=Streptomyces sp. NPDC089919 TaxID=3155188 RepID=UPI00341940DD